MTRGPLVRAGVVLLAVLGVAALSQATSTAAFVATTGNTADAVSAGSWCVAPTAQTLTATEDASMSQANANQTYGSEQSLLVRSTHNLRFRIVLRFPLPAMPAGCSITAASLRLFLRDGAGARQISAARLAMTVPWTESEVTWTKRPGLAGVRVQSTSPADMTWQTWSVPDIVAGLYASGNGGILLLDQNEEVGDDQQLYDSREGANPPQLVVTWG